MFFFTTYPIYIFFFFFSSRRRHTRLTCDWSSDVCSSDLQNLVLVDFRHLSCGAPSLRLEAQSAFFGADASAQCSQSLCAAKSKNPTHHGTCRSFGRAVGMFVESNLRHQPDS